MCGIFGFITSDGQGPDIDLLRQIAIVTQSRGDHAFGLAWVDRDDSLHVFKSPGSAEENLHELDHCRSAVAIVGHCRFATHGSATDNRNNHPHRCGLGHLVHNGIVTNHEELRMRYRLRPSSACDSEVLGLLMARGSRGTLTQRSAWLAREVRGDLALLALWKAPTRLLIMRRGRPLHFGSTGGGWYLGSLPQALPGQVREVTNRSTRVISYAAAERVLRRDGDVLDLDGD